ncbi:Hpt domain-containing protein [Catalinimonas sp. 4WD22]|uniref:Hpt domain-containing protein n=1 Tax=Catalinimonas locisalis TaxID=3133978 RepID=UPI003100F668
MSQENPQKLTLKTEQADLTYLYTLSDGDIDFMQEMVSAFISEIPETISLFEQYLKSEDWQAIGMLAHKIKPSIQTMGLNHTYELMKIIEVNGKKQQEVDELPTHTAQLLKTLRLVIPALQYELDQKFPSYTAER